MVSVAEHESRVAWFRRFDGVFGPFWLLVAIAAAAVFFHEGLLLLAKEWQTPEYSHGPLIPVLSTFLLLRQLKSVPVADPDLVDRLPGVAVVIASVLLGFLGILSLIDDLVGYAIIVWIFGVLLVSFGWRTGRTLWPPVLHLVFMLPLPGLLYFKLSTTLQAISSEFGIFLVQLAGVQAYLDGNIIDLGAYKLHVAEACSGLRYLFPILSFSYIFAVLYRGPTWHKAVLLLSAAPITVVMNSVRIGIVGILVEHFGIEHAEGFSHFMEGWVVFVVCVAMLFGLARLMLMMQKQGMTLVEALDLDTDEIVPQIARLRRVRPSLALIMAVGITAAAAAAVHSSPPRFEPDIRREPFLLFPREFGRWQSGPGLLLDPQIEVTLAADDYRYVLLENADTGATVDLFMAWYRDQGRGGIHSPEVCLPGAGWEIAALERVDIADRIGLDAAFPVNRAVIQRGVDRRLVYYWFEQYGGRSAWDLVAKANLLRDGLLYGRTDGALVRMVTALAPGEDPATADLRLLDALAPVVDALPGFIPTAATTGR